MNTQSVVQNIREILLKNWDPFCIGDNPNLGNEYDDFIPTIIDLLNQRSSSDEISEYFKTLEKQLDAPISDENRIRTVNALQSLS